MDRFDFYFEQLVTQADMDEAFDFAESADQRLQSDNDYVGIVQGLGVVQAFPTPNLTADIDAGVAYDPTGQRCSIASPQNRAPLLRRAQLGPIEIVAVACHLPQPYGLADDQIGGDRRAPFSIRGDGRHGGLLRWDDRRSLARAGDFAKP